MADRPEPPGPAGRASARQRKRDWRRRILGEPSSWRRMISMGIGTGVALAVVAALIAASLGGGGSSPLDSKPEPTSVSSDGGPLDGGGPIEEEPTDLPAFETPTEAPIEQPTNEPVATEPQPTEPAQEATPTEEPIEQPTDVPTVVGGT